MRELVSVVVVTYNSSAFILETLESVLNQSWKEIELIITDDCSEDNTVELCQYWLKDNEERFVRTEVITVDQNSGVSANANRGLYKAKGAWISFPAGDDTLKPNCIEDNMNWIASNPETRVLFSLINIYENTFEPGNFLRTSPGNPYSKNGIMAHGRTADSQYRMLLTADRIHFTPSAFLHRETLISVGGFDERFRLLEDHPLWLKLTKSGYRLDFMNKITVNYRRHSSSIYTKGKDNIINNNYFKRENFRRLYIYPNLPLDIRLNKRYVWITLQLFRVKVINKNNLFNRYLHSLLTVYLNPFKYYLLLRKRLDRSTKSNEFYK